MKSAVSTGARTNLRNRAMGVSTEEGLSFWLNLNNCVPTPHLPNINHNLLSSKGRDKSAVSHHHCSSTRHSSEEAHGIFDLILPLYTS